MLARTASRALLALAHDFIVRYDLYKHLQVGLNGLCRTLRLARCTACSSVTVKFAMSPSSS
jgi:hypothetical protein